MSTARAAFTGLDVYENVNPKILELYAGETRVLDVGCGAGALGGRIKEINPSALVHGIDVSPQAGVAASQRLDRFTCLDLDAGKLPPVDTAYDLIILGDVLEHLKRPDLLLLALRDYLGPDGAIIVSVPNVANFGIRWRLLLGEFNYTETGIMDKTHLRFFTCRTIAELVERCGFEITQRRYISRFPDCLARPFCGLLAAQLVYKLVAR